jgi:hypothetical protein
MFLSADGGRSRISGTASQGPVVDVFNVDGGRFRIFDSTREGATVDVFYVHGGRSRTSIRNRQGSHYRRFLALIVCAPGSPAPAPLRGSTDDGAHSRISNSGTSQGACHRCFLRDGGCS